MENVVKRAVEEYMAQREGNDEPEKLNSKVPKKKPQRQEHRLSGLLNKIRTKNNSAPKQKTIKRVQIKWYRYDENVEAYQLVRINQGGGCRFIEVNEDSNVNDLRYKATDLFFDDSFKNAYGENIMDCTFYICDASLNELVKKQTYLSMYEKRGFN